MKAISIKNPYATQILRGTKTIEYRSWDTKHCGDLLVCSSANPKVPGMLSGYAICVVNLVDTTYNAADDIYEWHLEDVKKIKAFPVKGKLNFFDVDDSLIHYPWREKGRVCGNRSSCRSASSALYRYASNAGYA